MSAQELTDSIEEYNEQLSQVSTALQDNTQLKDEEREQLEELQQNLLQLLELTLDQLQQVQQSPQNAQLQQLAAATNTKKKTEEEIRLEEELALFKSEIAELEEVADPPQTTSQPVGHESSSSDDFTGTRLNPGVSTETHDGNGTFPVTQAESKALDKRVHENKRHHREADWSSDASARNNRVSPIREDGDDSTTVPDVNVLLSRSRPSHGGFVKAWTYEEVCSLEGAAVRAPYTESWGGHTLHNALVLSVDEDGGFDAAFPQVLVLFSQPTCLAMLPCRFYLSNSCHYNDGSCQFSHGHPVPVDSLRPYTPPDPSLLVSGSRVLCRHPAVSSTPKRGKGGGGELWHAGVVEDVLKEERLVSVDCSVCSCVLQCDLGDAVPLTEEERGDTAFKLSDARHVTAIEDDEADDEDTPRRRPFAAMVEDVQDEGGPSSSVQQQFLLNPSSAGLGEWEKYTRGVGSRLMAAMGYVPGTGLGRDGEGRVEPVPAYLYPARVSLDRCMELREKSGGQDLLQVEKRLKKEQAQQEQRQQRQEERLAAQTSVFDIINNRLAGKSSKSAGSSSSNSGSSSNQPPVDVGRQQLKVDTTHALNLKSYQLSKNARLLQQEVNILTRSWDRQQGGKDTQAAERIHDKLKEKQRELNAVQAAEERISSEQHSRREKKKYVVF